MEVCNVGVQDPIEEKDETIITTGCNIAKIHDDGSMTLAPSDADEDS